MADNVNKDAGTKVQAQTQAQAKSKAAAGKPKGALLKKLQKGSFPMLGEKLLDQLNES